MKHFYLCVLKDQYNKYLDADTFWFSKEKLDILIKIKFASTYSIQNQYKKLSFYWHHFTEVVSDVVKKKIELQGNEFNIYAYHISCACKVVS